MTELAADVAIVGGGLMGASTALFLRRRGVSVVLLERGFIGQQASGVNFGNVRRQGRPMRQLPLANRAREIWGRLPQLTGSDVEFLPLGHLRVVYTRRSSRRSKPMRAKRSITAWSSNFWTAARCCGATRSSVPRCWAARSGRRTAMPTRA